MTDDREKAHYLGTWVLVPELCLYEEGEPPSSGLYTIAQVGDEVGFAIEWTDVQGQRHDVRFAGPDDGTRRTIAGQAQAELSVDRIGRTILDTSVFNGERMVSYARRCASLDGQLLSTVQQGYRADGTRYRNFQVYRRQARK